jgi:hypothetical protein
MPPTSPQPLVPPRFPAYTQACGQESNFLSVSVIAVPKAAVALSSLDQQPLRQPKRILVSTIARMAIGPDKQARTQPVAGTIHLSSTVQQLRLFPLQSDGSRGPAIPLEPRAGTYTIVLPTDKQTHWFVLEGK